MRLLATLLLISGFLNETLGLDEPTCIGDDGKLLTHGPTEYPGKCESYYKCDHGKVIIAECQEDKAFNKDIGVCDHPNNVPGCEYVDGIDPEEDLCRDGEGNLITSDIFPKEGTCDVYYQCDNGNLHETSCQPGLIFHPALKTCSYPHSAPPCEPGTTQYPSIDATSSKTTTKDTSSTTTTPLPTVTNEITESVSTTTRDIPLPSTTDNTGSASTTTTTTKNTPQQSTTDNTGSVSTTTTENTLPQSTTDENLSSTTRKETTLPPINNDPTFVVFVIDDSGSMENEIEAVRSWITDCKNGSYSSCAESPSGGWIVTSFNDPDVGPVIGPSTNIDDIIGAVSDLSAWGGGDCPEYSFTGAKNAVERVPSNSGCKVFFFSDAIPKDKTVYYETLNLYLSKNCHFIPILTGCCDSCEDPCFSQSDHFCKNHVTDARVPISRADHYAIEAERLFYSLASETGGSVYLANKPSSSDELFRFLKDDVTLGFCPTNYAAKPKTEDECWNAGSCWDRTLKKCFCVTVSCLVD